MHGAKVTPEQARARDGDFVSQCNLLRLQESLPLKWPTPAELPASPKKHYRSEYLYSWQAEWTDLDQLLAWKDLSDFDLLLRLVDFSRQTTPRDQAAHYICYTGSNQSSESPNHSIRTEATERESGETRYGYRSLPLRLADPLRRFSLTLLDDLRPANQHEDVSSAALFLQLAHYYPDLQVDAVAGNAGLGLEVFLHTIYHHLNARRVVEHRQHVTDRALSQWPTRGYDDRGRPICHYGYSLVSYGFDRARQRHKWCCDQACLRGKDPRVRLDQVRYPPDECPYQFAEQPHGRVINVGERFVDALIRLVRDLPFRSSTWKALYHRARNAVEGRNATFEGWGLKRMPVYGQYRSKALIFLADVLDTLTTLARLVRDATQASLVT